MSKDVGFLLRNLLNKDGAPGAKRSRQEIDEEMRKEEEEVRRRTKDEPVEQPRVMRPTVPYTPPPPRVVEAPEVKPATLEEELDPNCEHKWSYRAGKKYCWLCGGPAPTDRRDASTAWKSTAPASTDLSWRQKVYAKHDPTIAKAKKKR